MRKNCSNTPTLDKQIEIHRKSHSVKTLQLFTVHSVVELHIFTGTYSVFSPEVLIICLNQFGKDLESLLLHTWVLVVTSR